MGVWGWLFGSKKKSAHAQSAVSPSRSRGYGVTLENPVMTGKGPQGAAPYLRSLRCPNGKSLADSKRLGSDVIHDTTYVKANGGKPDPKFSRHSDEYINVDIYEIKCECGAHQLKVYVDMYHVCPDKCIDADGWTIVKSQLKQLLKKAASLTEGVNSPGAARSALKKAAQVLDQDPRLAQMSSGLRQTANQPNDNEVLAVCRATALKFREWESRA